MKATSSYSVLSDTEMASEEKYRWMLFVLLTAVWWSCEQVTGNQVVLLDTTKESSLDWTRYPYGPQARTPGWVEESFTNFEQGINWRSFVVCDVAYSNVNNWLWTPFVERREASRIYIEIKFSMRDCNLFPGMALSCKETFSLLYYEFDAATKEPPPWEPDSYKLVDRIAADEGRFTSTSEVIINTEVRSVPVTKKGVYFAFRDQGACLSLLAIKVYYVICPSIKVNFAFFPDSPTGREVTEILEVKGQCEPNSEIVEQPKMLCKGDGNWTLPSGGCKCKAGYEPMNHNCQVCPLGTYKSSVGDERCASCPLHSAALYKGSIECPCDDGYYRAPADPKDLPCSQPPSAPQNLLVSFVDQSTVILTWQPPLRSGGRNDTTFRIVCNVCSNAVSYVPSHTGFTETKATVSGLNPATRYVFQIYAENGVSSYGGSQFVDITVTTTASVYHVSTTTSLAVQDVRATTVKSTSIVLVWNPPSDPYTYTELYQIRYFKRGEGNTSSTILTKKLESSVSGLNHKTEYGFQVRAKTSHGWGEYSKPIYITTGQLVDSTAYAEKEGQVQVRIIAGATVAVVVLVVVVVVMIVLYIRRSSDDCNKKQPSDCDILDYHNGEVVPALEHPPIVPTAGMTTLLFTHCGGPRSYVDPHTYEDPNQAVEEFAKEIDASHITIEAIIGGGEFGDVCRGKLKVPSRPEMAVAIKTLKPGSPDKARVDFLTEASIMGQFDHPNVIYLQGVVTRSNPIMIITEYMDNGSLDTFLRSNDGRFQAIQLVGMLRGIAAGMQYLSDINYVHRDLAARNVLVNKKLICKIADFGLSREIECATEGAYTTRGGKIPVRWTAPEAIAFRKFTSASDVWSFGIVCWEVMSYGERPYWNWSNQDVIKNIEKGYRLTAPMDCPEAVHQLMLDCWQKERSYRPSFASIVKTLDKLNGCPDSLRKISVNKNQNPLDPHATDMTQFKSVSEWLNNLKMSRYLKNFDHAGVSTMEAVARLTHEDLTTLGVTLAGHQKKLLNSVQMLRAQMSNGFLV
ncbi:ephrin type-A receptor 4-like isoform X2 [Tachypleus tridentatus]|uniref:ephrin type-A receptor 4-like isoform X2 n=1 Tax=Tachypleus tridentatus TaxID=6853 RepID=UPI003FD59417